LVLSANLEMELIVVVSAWECAAMVEVGNLVPSDVQFPTYIETNIVCLTMFVAITGP